MHLHYELCIEVEVSVAAFDMKVFLFSRHNVNFRINLIFYFANIRIFRLAYVFLLILGFYLSYHKKEKDSNLSLFSIVIVSIYLFSSFSINCFNPGVEGCGAFRDTIFPSRSNTIKRGTPFIL